MLIDVHDLVHHPRQLLEFLQRHKLIGLRSLHGLFLGGTSTPTSSHIRTEGLRKSFHLPLPVFAIALTVHHLLIIFFLSFISLFFIVHRIAKLVRIGPLASILMHLRRESWPLKVLNLFLELHYRRDLIMAAAS